MQVRDLAGREAAAKWESEQARRQIKSLQRELDTREAELTAFKAQYHGNSLHY